MSNQKKMNELIKRISGQQNILTIPRLYIDLLDGDIDAALFLSQSVYWSDKGRGGWFYKSKSEWDSEIGMSRYKIERCTTKCAGIVETKLKKANGAPTVHYRVNMQALEDAICKFLDFQGIGTSDMQETYKSDVRETYNSLTETTQETTYQKPSAEKKAESNGYYSLAESIATVCKMDLSKNRGMLFAEAKRLNESPSDVIEHYGPGAWWYKNDWRGKKNQPPKPAQIRETWGQWQDNGATETSESILEFS